jgi:ectoine hydroxylase-related dioxygenase (phytanoyl-CoA dioxygenase family)
MTGLTPAQIAFFKEQGYLSLPEFIDPSVFGPLIAEFEAIIDDYTERAFAEGKLKDRFQGAPFDRRMALLYEAMGDIPELWRAVHGKNQKTAGMFAVITHPRFLDAVESLIGPEILAHPQFNSRAKLPGDARTVVPWHQDLGYLHAEADQTFMVNFWIPLVDAPMETGPLQVIPGSHRWGLIPHSHVDGYLGIPEAELPPHEIIDCPLPLGGVLLIQHKTVHRSTPNVSDRVRWSLDIRYSDPALPTGRAEVPGFLVRSRAHPEAVARSHHDWLAAFATV